MSFGLSRKGHRKSHWWRRQRQRWMHRENEVRKLSCPSHQASADSNGDEVLLLHEFFLFMAKLAPWIYCFLVSFPFQKIILVDPVSLMFPSSSCLVSLKAATSMSKRTSSRHTITVLLSGRSMFLMSIDIRTFHAPAVKGLKVTGVLSV